jgi:hypothetical protein
MHFHVIDIVYWSIWFICGCCNFFILTGYNNHKFKTYGHDDASFWILLVMFFVGGYGGLIVNLFVYKKQWAWWPLTEKQKDQYRMLRKLEEDSYHSEKPDLNQIVQRLLASLNNSYKSNKQTRGRKTKK